MSVGPGAVECLFLRVPVVVFGRAVPLSVCSYHTHYICSRMHPAPHSASQIGMHLALVGRKHCATIGSIFSFLVYRIMMRPTLSRRLEVYKMWY